MRVTIVLVFAFWVLAYGRFDCIDVYQLKSNLLQIMGYNDKEEETEKPRDEMQQNPRPHVLAYLD